MKVEMRSKSPEQLRKSANFEDRKSKEIPMAIKANPGDNIATEELVDLEESDQFNIGSESKGEANESSIHDKSNFNLYDLDQITKVNKEIYI